MFKNSEQQLPAGGGGRDDEVACPPRGGPGGRLGGGCEGTDGGGGSGRCSRSRFTASIPPRLSRKSITNLDISLSSFNWLSVMPT